LESEDFTGFFILWLATFCSVVCTPDNKLKAIYFVRMKPVLILILFSVIFLPVSCSKNSSKKTQEKIESSDPAPNNFASTESEKKVPKDKVVSLSQSYLEVGVTHYAGYEIRKREDEKKKEIEITVTKNRKKFLSYKVEQMLSVQSLDIALFPFLSQKSKQLVSMEYSGGAHCCWGYKIYELSPKFRKIFDGDNYGMDWLGYELDPIDIDKDGTYEFTQSVMAFDYFRVSHASSVFPTAVFAYNKAQGKYTLANRRFSNYLLINMPQYLKEAQAKNLSFVEDSKHFPQEDYVQAISRVILDYIYAGEREKGFEYFEKNYKMSDKDEFRKELKETLRKDPIYQSIY
jgi:hypothetical protein